jgi:hypothetical protein
VLMLGCAARYTWRRLWLGTSLVFPRPNTARSSRHSSVRTKSHKLSYAHSCAIRPFFRRHLLLSSNLRTARVWILRVAIAACWACVTYGMPYVARLLPLRTFNDSRRGEKIPTILEALDTLDDTTARTLRSAPLLRFLLASPDSGARGLTASHLRSRYRSRIHARLPAGVGNLDIAVLRPENQHPTHVTPRIAELATGLFREQLVVLGRRLPASRSRRVTDASVYKRERDTLMHALAMALCANGTQSIEAPVSWRVHPRRPFMNRVALCDVRGLLPKVAFTVRFCIVWVVRGRA